MSDSTIDRRRFHELSAAALGGLVMGSALGCGGANPPATATAGEKHLCRGLNECKGHSKSGKNDCRGQGDCATLAAHGCGKENACKGQGGCGETVGLNECKGKGDCSVPLMEDAWKTVRKRMEEKWEKASQKFSPPPEKKTPEKKV